MDASTPSTPSTPSVPSVRSAQTSVGVPPILVASGHRALHHAVRERLAGTGYVVASAASTSNTLAYLHFATLPHLVLLDFRLPPRTAEPLLHVVALDDILQRHHYLLALTSPRIRFSRALERLINAYCTDVVTVTQLSDSPTLHNAIARAAARLSVEDAHR